MAIAIPAGPQSASTPAVHPPVIPPTIGEDDELLPPPELPEEYTEADGKESVTDTVYGDHLTDHWGF